MSDQEGSRKWSGKVVAAFMFGLRVLYRERVLEDQQVEQWIFRIHALHIMAVSSVYRPSSLFFVTIGSVFWHGLSCPQMWCQYVMDVALGLIRTFHQLWVYGPNGSRFSLFDFWRDHTIPHFYVLRLTSHIVPRFLTLITTKVWCAIDLVWQ